uniref:Uncharacterized protein n=1 Tax=Haemonchus contortus TaxID=6289 RepID=A0A7I4YK15_HAECO
MIEVVASRRKRRREQRNVAGCDAGTLEVPKASVSVLLVDTQQLESELRDRCTWKPAGVDLMVCSGLFN